MRHRTHGDKVRPRLIFFNRRFSTRGSGPGGNESKQGGNQGNAIQIPSPGMASAGIGDAPGIRIVFRRRRRRPDLQEGRLQDTRRRIRFCRREADALLRSGPGSGRSRRTAPCTRATPSSAGCCSQTRCRAGRPCPPPRPTGRGKTPIGVSRQPPPARRVPAAGVPPSPDFPSCRTRQSAAEPVADSQCRQCVPGVTMGPQSDQAGGSRGTQPPARSEGPGVSL
jgi:hypothetical protein